MMSWMRQAGPQQNTGYDMPEGHLDTRPLTASIVRPHNRTGTAYHTATSFLPILLFDITFCRDFFACSSTFLIRLGTAARQPFMDCILYILSTQSFTQ